MNLLAIDALTLVCGLCGHLQNMDINMGLFIILYLLKHILYVALYFFHVQLEVATQIDTKFHAYTKYSLRFI